jgi:prepilin-type N-terminal cleavage/methylation domain-containing protein
MIDTDRHPQRIDAGPGGFTLVEILLVMLITSILVLGVNAAFHQAHAIWASAEDRRPFYHHARLILDTLREELAGLYLPPVAEGQEPPFRLASLPDGSVELAFDTLSPSWKGDLASSRIARVCYVFAKDPAARQTILRRMEQPWAGERPIGIEAASVVATGLSAFLVQALMPRDARGTGQEGWQASYESKDKAPRALKVELRWDLKDRREQLRFESCLWISAEAPLQPEE